MTNKEIMDIAMAQSAVDLNCQPQDFCKETHVVVTSACQPGARKYLKLPFECQLVSYGTNMVASVDARLAEPIRQYIERFPMEHCFSTPMVYALNEEIQKLEDFRSAGVRVCFMAEYFLPDMDHFRVKHCEFETRLLGPEDFAGLYIPSWSNALCADRKALDVLGVGAYDRGQLIGLAGCSADCDTMWQIGIDVLPEYRRGGIASVLTSQLAAEIMNREKVPFYCAAWSNLRSVRNAISSGFRPAWVELTARNGEIVSSLFSH